MFPAEKSTKSGLMALVFTLFIALLPIACGLTGPAAAVERFHRNINDGRIEEALGQIATESVEELGKDKLRTVLRSATKQVQEKGGIKTSRIEKESITGEIAAVTIYIEHGDGSSDFHDVDLVQEGGEWKILFNVGK